MKTVLAALMLVGILPVASAADDVVARMGTLELTAPELKEIVETEAGEAAFTALNPAQLERLARIELVRRKVAAEARAQGWEKRANVVSRMNRAAETALVSSWINNLARPPAAFPSAEEVRAAYDANRDKITAPASYRAAQIFIANGQDAAKAEHRARDLARDVAKKGADFAELARKNSDHAASAARGGDLGWLPENQLIPEMKSVLTTMKPGEISKPVKTTRGWHIVKLIEFKAGGIRAFEEVKESLAQALRLRKAREVEARYLEDLLAKAPVAVNEIVLQKLATGK